MTPSIFAKKKKKKKITKAIKHSFTREVLGECVAGFTDSVFTQFLLTICYYLFETFDWMRSYFINSTHIYWLFYFVHVNIIDSYVWGQTYRCSTNYVYDKRKQYSPLRLLTVVFCQYLFVFLGAWFSIAVMHASNDASAAINIQSALIGARTDPQNLSFEQQTQFIWQSLLFQIVDRVFAGIIVTISPLLKRNTYNVLDGAWTIVSVRCALAHALTVRHRMGLLLNPNYAVYGGLFYWRWTPYDWICIILPWISLAIYDRMFRNVTFLYNSKYFDSNKTKTRKTRKKNQ
mmetsp:Transcript_59096/g.97703  ORF Transcript_59096/g.97703 Transcript_59096/m.97703 type:complete len:289 (-) Transcript_59096:69-935(-)